MISGISAHNQEIIDKYLTGRIYPEIYAFRTGSIPEYIKVGDTYRGVNVRLDEWRRVYENLSEIFRHPALIDENTIFRDHSVHKFLENVLHKHRLRSDENPKGLYWSNEFFHDTDADDIRSAIADIEHDYLRNGSKYHFYTLDHIPQELIPPRDDKELTPRDNQKEAIDKFIKAVDNGQRKLLMYAVMRFGKKFTSLCCAKAIGARKILILTAKPNVMREWRNAVLVTKNFYNYNKFLTSKDLIRDPEIIHSLVEAGENVVVFLSLQDLSGKKTKKKHEQVISTDWDIVIIDETHFGARASSYGEIVGTLDKQQKEERALQREAQCDSKKEGDIEDLKQITKTLKSKVSLHLSGTPYRILMGNEFSPEQIVASVQYSDILEAKEQWQHDNCTPEAGKNETEETDSFKNPYFGFPKMIRFAFNPGKSALQLIKSLQAEGYSSALSMLLKPESINKKPGCQIKFKYEPQVLELLGAIDGHTPSENILPFLGIERIQQGKLCRHIVMVLPYRASCDAMEQLLLQHTEFENLSQYKILNIAGFDCPSELSSPENVVSAIKDYENSDKKTITLTVNRMLTGSTVPQWDTMFFLKDTRSPEEYDQATFRLQSPYIKELTSIINGKTEAVKIDMKPQTILVDFSPERVFMLQEQRSLVINATKGITGNDALQPQIEREVHYSPIITFDHQQLTELSSPDIMQHIRKYKATRSICDEASYMPVDADIIKNLDIKSFISTLRPIDDKKGLSIEPKEGSDDNNPTTGTPPQDNSSKSSTSHQDSTSDDSKLNEEKEFIKKLKAYYARIFFYAFLTNSEVNNLNSLISSINDNEDNLRIARHLGLEPEMLKKIARACHYQSRNYLDYRIESINKIWREMSGTPIENAKFALQKFGRMSESEVVTPAHIADDMVALLPEDVFTKGPVLDIASKQGEFTIALIKRYGNSVGDKIYSICTSMLAYEFTRKIYELLSLPVSHIFDKFTSFDIIQKENKKQSTILQELKSMNFSAILGNPPYQVNDGSGASDDASNPIYQDFVNTSQTFSPKYISMIMPSKWMVGGKVILKSFRSSMMNDSHIALIVDYENDQEVFSTTHNDGGICYFLYDESYDAGGKLKYIFHLANGNVLESNRTLKDGESDIVIRDSRRLTIIDKVSKSTKLFKEIVSLTQPYGIRKDLFNSPERYPTANLSETPFDGCVKIYGVKGIKGGAKRTEGYISPMPISRNENTVEQYKLFFTTSYSTNAINPPQAIIGNKNEICTETFLLIGPFSSQTEQLNCKKFFDTNFFKVLLFFGRGTMQVSKDVFRFVPLQDFTENSDIDWSKSVEEIDAQLYAKYNLSDEEIAFIESMIKPM